MERIKHPFADAGMEELCGGGHVSLSKITRGGGLAALAKGMERSPLSFSRE